MSVLFINMEESSRYCVSFYRPEIDFILPLCSFACLTCSLRAEQRCYKCAVISKGDHFVHFSSRESKEAATDRKQLFIRTDSLNVAGAVSTMSRTTGPSIFVSFILRETPTVPAQTGGLLFSRMLSRADMEVSI